MTLPCAARRARIAAIPLFLAAGFVFGGCGDRNDDAFEEPMSAPLPFASIGYGDRGALRDTLETVIRDSTTWANRRKSLRPLAPFQSVDFSRAMVLLAALPQTTSGHSVSFLSLNRTDTVIVAEYVVEAPGEDCLTSAAESVPFEAVQTPVSDVPIRFQRIEDEYRCAFGPPR